MDRTLIEDLYPLSPVQGGILFHTLEEAQPGMYLNQWVYDLEGDADLGAVRQAAERVVRRHAALRTCFVWEGRTAPVQVVLREVRLPWQEHDWREMPEAEREERLSAFLAADRARGFDLGKPPLLRLAAFRLPAGRAVLVWTHHHILLDGWSLAVIFGEVAALYEEITTGRPAELTPPRSYGDYIGWLQDKSLEQAEQYWRRTFRGFHDPTPVPLAKCAAGRRGRGERYPQIERHLYGRLTETLQALARRHQLTVSTLVQGAWALLLARHADAEDVVFGVTMSGRPPELAGVEQMVGLFINTLPMRVLVAPGARLDGWMRDIQGQLIEARQYEHTPLREIRNWSEVPRSVPLFETFVNSFSASLGDPDEGRSVLRVRSSRSVIEANYPFSLGVSQEPHLELRASYDGHGYQEASARRVLVQLEVLLAAFAGAMERPLSELSLLGPEEERQVLHAWNGARRPPPRSTVPELFELAADAAPDTVVLACGDLCLSYRELDLRANRLARHLRKLGVGPEVPVGLHLERSVDAIVALLAVLKAGGVYVAVEPGDPQERRRRILNGVGARAVIARGGEAAALGPGLRIVDLDAAAERIARESGERLAPMPDPANLAYLLFTSGSTGEPKGVAVEHRQIVHYAAAVAEALELEPGMSYALVSTLAADLGNTSLYPALLGRGRLHLMAPDDAMDGEAAAALFRRHGIDCLKIVPSHLKALLQGSRAAGPLPSSHLVLGGEASTWEDVDRLRALAPGLRIFNHYGPTETTVGIATFDVARASEDHRACHGIPLGSPLANVRIRILDAHGLPVPVGVAGELCAGGAGLARGYTGDPATTADRFRPDPHAATPGERLYRTGDRSRWLEDGTLELLGRLDHQVKLRGFRVELGEIEALLRERPEVDQAVAVVRDAGPDARIIAYVAGAAGTAAGGGLDDGTYRLPNGMMVSHRNEHETRALFEEIFVKRSYFRHGVRLPDHGCVVDVGANIGLFSLLVSRLRPKLPVYAFEPARPVFELLRANAARQAGRIEVFDCGLAERAKTDDFTYYPLYSTQSGLASLADVRGDVEAVRAVLRNSGAGVVVEADELRLGFEAENLSCRFERLSDFLRRERVERVGLLKVDVQRAELEVLAGIDETDWPRIDQVVLEVHDQVAGDGDRVRRLAALLESRGFQTTVEQDDLLRGTDRYNVYAVRELPAAAAVEEIPEAIAVAPPALSAEELRSYLAGLLPEPAVPATVVVLDRLPLTPNGKIDRESLPDPEVRTERRVRPRTDLERRLVKIWSDILATSELGVEDNFFDRGGHSLRAMQLITRMRREFSVELSLREFLGSPTIAGLGTLIAQKSAARLDDHEVVRILEQLEETPRRRT